MSGTQPPPKRSKISIACTSCRDRKVRCDGNRPACQRCVKRGIQATCTFTPVSTVMTIPCAVNGRNLEQEYLEGPQLDHNYHATDEANGPDSVSAPQSSNGTLSTQLTGHELNQVDALATVSPSDNHEQLEQLYGGSSTIAFVRSVAGTRGLTRRRDTASSTSREDVALRVQRTSFREDSRPQITTSELYPRRASADDFLHCYWEFSFPVFPVVHKPSITHEYNKIWAVEASVNNERTTSVGENLFRALINLMFALGCQYSNLVPLQNRRRMAEDFYERSRQSFSIDTLDFPSITHVQVLLLNGIYLQSTRYASRCWNFVGLAIRVAQSLGLHLEQRGKFTETQLDREMRKRVWFNCKHLDRLLAMTFGRPAMISSKTSITLPLIIDDEYLERTTIGSQPVGIPSRMGLFVCSSQLFDILGDVLAVFYAEDPENEQTLHLRLRILVSHALEFGRRLDDFYDSVPSYLKISNGTNSARSSRNTCVQLQQQVLYCRFLYTRVLSLRPVLLLATQEERNTINGGGHIGMTKDRTLDDTLVTHCANLCLTTCFKLIRTLHENLSTAYRSSGWHAVYFIFASAIVLLAGSTCSVIEPDNLGETYNNAWTSCCAILNHYKEQIPSASRALQILDTLRAQIDSERRSGETGTSNPEPDKDLSNTGLGVKSPGNDIRSHGQHQSDENSEQTDFQNFSFDFTYFNPSGTASMSDAWFGQHMSDLNWLTFDQFNSN